MGRIEDAWQDEYLLSAVPGDIWPLRALDKACIERMTALRGVYLSTVLERDDKFHYDLTPPKYTHVSEWRKSFGSRASPSILEKLRHDIFTMSKYYIDPSQYDGYNNAKKGPYRYYKWDIVNSEHSLLYTPKAHTTLTHPEGLSAYRRFLMDCKYWLTKFRYIDATRICKGRRIKRSWTWSDNIENGTHAEDKPAATENGETIAAPSNPSELAFRTNKVVEELSMDWLPSGGIKLETNLYRSMNIFDGISTQDPYGHNSYSSDSVDWDTTQVAGIKSFNPAPFSCDVYLWVEGNESYYTKRVDTGDVTAAEIDEYPVVHPGWSTEGWTTNANYDYIWGTPRITKEEKWIGPADGCEHTKRTVTYKEDGTVDTDETVTLDPAWQDPRNYIDTYGTMPALYGFAEDFGTLAYATSLEPRSIGEALPDEGKVRSPGGECAWNAFYDYSTATKSKVGYEWGNQGWTRVNYGAKSLLRVIYDYYPGFTLK